MREVVPVDGGIALELGNMWAAKLTLTSEGKLERCGELCEVVMLYHRHIARTPAGEYLPAFTIGTGPVLLTCDGGIKRTGISFKPESCPFVEGACGYGERLVAILRGRYLCLDDPTQLALQDELKLCQVEGARLRGNPFICGSRLVLLERCSGTVEVLDISDPHAPYFLERVETGLHPEFADEADGRILVACGHGGIVEIK